MTIDTASNMPEPTLTDWGLAESVIESLATTIEQISPALDDVQQALHSNPEIAWHEFYAHDVCCKFMEEARFTVTRRAYGFDTAWRAEWSNGNGPTMGFNAEMDAVPGLGHACGRNLIAALAMAGAIATARFMEAYHIPGKVVLLGTPAEEMGLGKSHMLKRGAYEDMDICLMAHPGGRCAAASVLTMPCSSSLSADFYGRSAHTSAPENGVNALDAAVLAYSSVSLLRQHIRSTESLACTIKGSENWNNLRTPSKSRVIVGVRAPTAAEAMPLMRRVANCLAAAGMATGCSHDLQQDFTYLDLRNADVLADYFEEVCDRGWKNELYGCRRITTGASTDFGSVSYRLPALHAGFGLPEADPGDGPRSKTYAACTKLPSSHRSAMKVATGLAVVAARFLVDRTWASDVRLRWEAQMTAIGASSILEEISEMDRLYPSRSPSLS